MMLTRWEPFLGPEWTRLQNEMDRLFRRFGETAAAWPGLAASYPALNIWEDDNHVYAEAELPGMTHDQLQIYVTAGNRLTVQGERQPDEHLKGVWHRRERGVGAFSRTVELPVPVDADKVEARFEHGVLRVTLPKSEQAKPRRITVKSE